VIWTPSAADSIWVPEHRFGTLGGRGLAFYGAIWGKGGSSVLAGGWNGGWERWAWNGEDSTWDVKPGVTGHHGEVESISWDSKGEYLLSVSLARSLRCPEIADVL
jgi:elongator complex protein 2